MVYRDFKDLAKRPVSDKVFRAINIAKNPEYDTCQRGLASMIYNFFGKKSKVGSANNEIKQDAQLVAELRKPIIKNV